MRAKSKGTGEQRTRSSCDMALENLCLSSFLVMTTLPHCQKHYKNGTVILTLVGLFQLPTYDKLFYGIETSMQGVK